jgi:hypothetical protein
VSPARLAAQGKSAHGRAPRVPGTARPGRAARAAFRPGQQGGTSDLPNVARSSHGPGWALAGDAGLVMDPITGLGIGHALRDAELLSTAILQGSVARRTSARHLPAMRSDAIVRPIQLSVGPWAWHVCAESMRSKNACSQPSARTRGKRPTFSASSPASYPPAVLQPGASDSSDRNGGLSATRTRSFVIISGSPAG